MSYLPPLPSSLVGFLPLEVDRGKLCLRPFDVFCSPTEHSPQRYADDQRVPISGTGWYRHDPAGDPLYFDTTAGLASRKELKKQFTQLPAGETILFGDIVSFPGRLEWACGYVGKEAGVNECSLVSPVTWRRKDAYELTVGARKPAPEAAAKPAVPEEPRRQILSSGFIVLFFSEDKQKVEQVLVQGSCSPGFYPSDGLRNPHVFETPEQAKDAAEEVSHRLWKRARICRHEIVLNFPPTPSTAGDVFSAIKPVV